MLRFALPYRMACIGALGMALVACDIGGIGSGTRPERLEIVRGSSALDPDSNRTYECFTDQLFVLAYFDDNRQVGDFTGRPGTEWSSSNPAVALVSNGDIPVEGVTGMVYSPGTVIPKGPGTAIITASFSILRASYEIEVVQPTDIKLDKTRLAIAPNTLGGLRVLATIDGEEVDVTSSAVWTLLGEDAADTAAIGASTGVVFGSAEGTVKARADFQLCPTLAGDLEADVVVSPVQSILLTREFDTAPNDELVSGTTDQLKAIATLESGDTQDLTSQLSYASDDEGVVPIGPAGIGAGNVPGLMRGNDEGVALVTATYTGIDPEDDDIDAPTVDSNAVTFAVVEDTVAAVTITPAGVTLRTNSSQQFEAEATYTAVPTRKQRITRHVNWVSSDTQKLAVGVGFNSAGLAVSGTAKTEEDEPVTLTARFTLSSGTDPNSADDDIVVSDEVEICIIEPDDDVPDECPALIPE